MVALGSLGVVHFYTLPLYHDKPCIYPLHLGHQLFLGNGSGFGLFDDVGDVIVGRIQSSMLGSIVGWGRGDSVTRKSTEGIFGCKIALGPARRSL